MSPQLPTHDLLPLHHLPLVQSVNLDAMPALLPDQIRAGRFTVTSGGDLQYNGCSASPLVGEQATAGTTAAQHQGDNFRLVWREVKRVLRVQGDEAQPDPTWSVLGHPQYPALHLCHRPFR